MQELLRHRETSSNESNLQFFPTPYPDEILYSVLCRYHLRSGNVTVRTTNFELWGKLYGKGFYLPDAIHVIADKIPILANLTTERFISENTVFHWLKPFVPKGRAAVLFDALKFGSSTIYSKLGTVRTTSFKLQNLRYCPICVKDDVAEYGEPYWHRLHQLPSVWVCSKHDVPIVESSFQISEVPRNFYDISYAEAKNELRFNECTHKTLLQITKDTEWLLQNGNDLGYYEQTYKLYDGWLRSKGYRLWNGRTSVKKLGADISAYYGLEVLGLLDAYNSGTCAWAKSLLQHVNTASSPTLHLLLMRFLAGSAQVFFNGCYKQAPEYQPFGAPPYPCRNHICEHHLQDVINKIEIKMFHGTPHANFNCPYCGFSYNRKGNTPKSEQYSGQIHVASYGWLWEEKVSDALRNGKSEYVIAKEVHCDVRTIQAFAVEHGLLSPERAIKRKLYVAANLPIEKGDFNLQLEAYRRRWLTAMLANPTATRSELRLIDGKANQWLHKNDADWYEQQSPPSKKGQPLWINCDDEYFERIECAMKQIRDSPGRPKRLSLPAIGKAASIRNLERIYYSGRLPRTTALLDANVEILEQWQRRKIRWAVQQLRERGEVLTVYKVRHFATIMDKERKQDAYIQECIDRSE
jgi:hypothetical protein